MAKWIGVITNGGNKLFGEWVNEKTLNFANVMFGTGVVATEAMMSQSDLVSKMQIASIVGSERVDAGIRLKIQITAADVGYTLNQIGIWASIENEDPVMIALYQFDTGVPVPSKTENPEFVYTFYALISSSNSSPWTVKVDTSALVSREELDREVENLAKKVTVLPDSLAKRLCPGIEDPTPVDALEALANIGVVAQGKKGNWLYRQWASGIAECWLHITLAGQTHIQTPWGGLYESELIEGYDFPFKFDSLDICVVTADHATSGLIVEYAEGPSLEKSPAIALVRGTPTQDGAPLYNINLRIYAAGTWIGEIPESSGISYREVSAKIEDGVLVIS